MRSHPLLAAAFVVTASVTVAQIAIPAHNNVYNGYSRGLHFAAQTSFYITALDLPTIARQVGDTASYLVRVNGATALWSVGNAGQIATSIQVAPGDLVDVIANWSAAAAGSFSARNSYGSGMAGAGAAPYVALIEGVPHTLMRCGWQWDIGDPTWAGNGSSGTYLAPTTGQIGRVLVTTSPSANGVLATNAVLGHGCVAAYNSFYESFATALPASTALTGGVLLLIPTASGYQGSWLPGSASAFFVPPVAGVALATGDDGVVAYPIASGAFATAQGPQTQLLVSGNGIVAWGGAAIDYPGSNSYTPSPGAMLNSTLGGVYFWHDYNVTEAGSGQILAEEAQGVLYLTWNGVESYASPETANPSTVQAQFDLATGIVRLVFVSVDSNVTSAYGSAHVIGVSAPGPSNNPGTVPLATGSATQLLAQSPEVAPLAVSGVSRPVLGTAWTLQVSNIPATGLVGVDVIGLSDPGINDLSSLGAPGCGLRASLDVMNVWTGTTHTFSLPIPTNPALLNFNLYTTSAVFQFPPVNAFGAITANGIQGKIGDF
ncbi:MAG: hypothetical protein FJ301_13465 [Planctomycetes bacterium]|nr:hypothetical protein [Planctomycetota bacterium]